MGLSESISNAVAGHEDQVKAGIDKVGDLVDEQTDNKFVAQVDQAQDFLKSQVDANS